MTEYNRDNLIAHEIEYEIRRALGPILPETLTDRDDVVCAVFERVFNAYDIRVEAEAERIVALVPALLAEKNRKFFEFQSQLGAAVRGVATGSI